MIIKELDLSGIEDEKARAIIGQLLNLIEELSSELREARAEIQRLRDEVNRLKGEQGKPKIKGNTPKPPVADHSSEKERRIARPRHKRSKKAEIRIDREETLEIDPLRFIARFAVHPPRLLDIPKIRYSKVRNVGSLYSSICSQSFSLPPHLTIGPTQAT